MRKGKKLTALFMAFAMMITGMICSGTISRADNCGGLEEIDVYTPEDYEVIQDPVLHWAVRASMNAIKSGVKLTKEMVADKSVKDISYELCSHPEEFEKWEKQYWIESLEGLQYATSANMIDICYTAAIDGKKISDLSPLSGLTQLKMLILKQDGLTDIGALTPLVNLEQLDVSGNKEITDLSAVTDMTKLRQLSVGSNQIQSIEAIEGLENLEYADFSSNQISKLPDMSRLTKLTSLDLSHNKLTDISALKEVKALKSLNLSGNTGITDYTPLALLVNLEEDLTFLPDGVVKEDLFAAIGVNKLFRAFNISKMTENDITNVEKALEAYEALTPEQKAFMDERRVEAARSNKELVAVGKEPVYYEEYDEEGIRQPVFDRIEIKVVDKHGNALANVPFEKLRSGSVVKTQETGSDGLLVLKHSPTDSLNENTIRPAGDTYIAFPEEIRYTVNWSRQTETINGKPATGMEDITFVLYQKDEYVDKTELKEAIAQAESAEESYKYTADSYKKYQDALGEAQKVLKDADASEQDVQDAAEKLMQAFNGLKKAEILTTLKMIVKDENGNPFTRPFKFQVRITGAATEQEAQMFNIWSDENGVAYFEPTVAMKAGQSWDIWACYHERYLIDNFYVVLGEKDGQVYFKEAGEAGKPSSAIGVDFEKELTARYMEEYWPLPEEDIILPDSTVLEAYIEKVKGYTETDYTPSTWRALQDAVSAAESVIGQNDVRQEDYNQSVADLKAAEAALTARANKAELKKKIDVWYGETNYTASTWAVYKEALQNANAVYANGDATQEEVDRAAEALQKAQNQLKLLANKTQLKEALDQAKALKEEDYISGFEELLKAIDAAQNVYDEEDAAQADVDAQVKALEDAMGALEEKPQEIKYDCLPGMFRARVVDGQNKPLAGVKFQAWIDSSLDADIPIVSDDNGIITYTVYGPIQYGHTTFIKLADDRYSTENEHYFTVESKNIWASMDMIDGQPYADGTRLQYVLKPAGENPNPPVPGDQVLSDSTTFRAKVVDEQGNPVNGVVFDSIPDDEFADSYELESVNGVIEQEITSFDYNLTFTVSMQADQDAGDGKTWVCAEEHTFKTDGTMVKAPKITHVDGKELADAEEIVFVLKKSGGDTPDPGIVDKSALKEQIDIAHLYDGKEADYTKESYDALKEAISQAEAVYNNADATKAEVEEWTGKLEAAWKGLQEVEKPIVCDKYTVRILVADEAGNKAADGIEFARAFDNGYPGTTYTRDGVLEYNVSTADMGIQTITFSLKNDSVTVGDKEYTVEPEKHVFTLSGSSTDVRINEIDGTALEGTREVKFVLKEKTDVPVPVEKTALLDKLNEVKAIEQGNYTLNSYRALMNAIEEAQKVYDNQEVSQADVDAAVTALETAKEALKEVTGMRTLTIPVTMQDGQAAPMNTQFIRYDVKYRVPNKMYANGGELVWKVGAYDGGDYEFYLPEDSAYIATPALIRVHVGDEDGTPVIDTINGQPAADGMAKFVLTSKSTDTCDILTFRAFVQDQEGHALPGVAFRVKNGDPNEIVSDADGMITYAVTAWDTDTTMTVTLKDGQGWMNAEAVEFTVIVDPDDENRGIISTVNGKPVAESGRIVFTLEKEVATPVVDKTQLQAAMEAAGALDASKYTEESFAKVTEELAKAIQVNADEEASQEAVDAQTDALNAAIQALDEKPVVPTPSAPQIVEGANGVWVKGSKAELTFRSDAEYTDFVRVLVDGKELTEEQYSVVGDDTLVTLKQSYLETLSVGQHTLGIESKNGTAQTNFTIQKEVQPDTPAPEKPGKPSDTDGKKPFGSDGKKPSGSGTDKPTNSVNTAVQTGNQAPVVGLSMLMMIAVLTIAVECKRRIHR